MVLWRNSREVVRERRRQAVAVLVLAGYKAVKTSHAGERKMLVRDGLPGAGSRAVVRCVHRLGAGAGFSGFLPRCYPAQAPQHLKRDKGLQWPNGPGYLSAGQIYRQF